MKAGTCANAREGVVMGKTTDSDPGEESRGVLRRPRSRARAGRHRRRALLLRDVPRRALAPDEEAHHRTRTLQREPAPRAGTDARAARPRAGAQPRALARVARRRGRRVAELKRGSGNA